MSADMIKRMTKATFQDRKKRRKRRQLKERSQKGKNRCYPRIKRRSPRKGRRRRVKGRARERKVRNGKGQNRSNVRIGLSTGRVGEWGGEGGKGGREGAWDGGRERGGGEREGQGGIEGVLIHPKVKLSGWDVVAIPLFPKSHELDDSIKGAMRRIPKIRSFFKTSAFIVPFVVICYAPVSCPRRPLSTSS